MIVYKYLHPDRIDVLQNAAIRFSQPVALNDPFESLPCFSEYREHLRQVLLKKRVDRFGPESANVALDTLDLMIDARLHALPETLGQYFVILSLSKTRSNLLMWAHYADCHRGFVVGFDVSNEFFKPGNGKSIDGLRDVEYSAKRERVPAEGLQNLTKAQMHTLNEGWFFTKSDDWAYEEEVRILAEPQAADRTLPGPDGCDICLFKFPRDAVKEVVFGMQMSVAQLGTMIGLCTTHYPNTGLSIASLNSERFTVDIKPIRAENIQIFKQFAAK